jgi:hypothetical protein
MNDRAILYRELYQLLTRLDFVEVSRENKWKAFQRRGSEMLILLADREPDTPARVTDLVSVRRHLIESGVIDRGEFERLLS